MSETPLRVLQVARWYPAHDDPGRGTFVGDTAAALADRGLEVRVASFEVARVRGSPEQRASTQAAARSAWSAALDHPSAFNTPRAWGPGRIPVARLPALYEADRRDARSMIEAHAALLIPFATALARRWPVDVIHAHTGLPDGVAAQRVAGRIGVPLLVTEHDSTIAGRLADPVVAAEYRALLTEGTRVVAVSHALRNRLAAALDLPAEVIPVIPNVVPVSDFPRPGSTKRDPNELLWVGTRARHKGTDLLLRAFAVARAERPDLHLRLIGRSPDDPGDEEWRRMAGSLGLEGAVQFDPPASRTQVGQALSRAAVFVHPSPFETFGMVAAEALACGLPVAATPSGGVDEILGQGDENGTLAAAFDPDSLARAIVDVLARHAAFDGERMREDIEHRFGPLAVTNRLLEAYSGLGAGAASREGRPVASGTSATSTDPERRDDLPPRIVIALDRKSASSRLALLPSALAASLAVVTSVATPQGEAGGLAVGILVEIDPDAEYRRRLADLGGEGRGSRVRRALRALRHPRGFLARIELTRIRPRLRKAVIRRGLAEALSKQTTEIPNAPSQPAVVAVDADDVAAVGDLLAHGARLAPGGLRWLADRWDERRGALEAKGREGP
jgi:glycosyltransferase involved in cell wall biosynthesis